MNDIMILNMMVLLVLGCSIVFYYSGNLVASFSFAPFYNLIPAIKAVLLFSAFFSAGHLLFRIFRYKIESKYRCFVEFIIGTQFVVYLVLFMGMAGWLKSVYLYIIIIFLVGYNLKVLLKNMSNLTKIIHKFLNTSSIFDKFLVLILIVLSFIIVFSSYSPVSWFDSLDYHMAVPFKYFTDGQITNFSGNVYSNFPLNAEMINLTAFLFNNELISKLMISGHLILLMIVTGMFTFDISKNSTLSLFSSIILGSNMIVFKQIIQGNIDLYVTFTYTVILIYLYQFRFQKKAYFIVSALLLGALAGYKYTTVPFFIFPVFLYLIFTSMRKKGDYKYLFLVPLISLFVFSPWMIKNYMFTGNPLYPFCSWIFKSESWTGLQAVVFNNFHRPETLNLSNYSWTIFTQLDGVLLLLTLFSLRDKNNKIFIILLYLSIILWSLLSLGKGRFILPVYPVLLSFALFNMRRLLSKRMFSLSKIILILFVIFRVSSMLILKSNMLPYALGVKPVKERLNEFSDPYFKGVDFLNRYISPTDKVLFLSEFRSYPCRFKYSLATLFDFNPLEYILKEANSCSHLLKLCSEEGYTHIFFNYLEFQRLQKHYKHHFPVVTGFYFQPDSKESILFFELLNKIKKDNKFPDDLSPYLVLYSIKKNIT